MEFLDLQFFLFIYSFTTAVESIRFEINLHFIWIQTYRIFFFSRRLFAKQHALSSWRRIFHRRFRSCKIRLLLNFFFFIVVMVISICLKTSPKSASGDDRTRIKSLLRRSVKNLSIQSRQTANCRNCSSVGCLNCVQFHNWFRLH